MFFMRLRRRAKWVFLFLVFAFAFTFLFAGVGGGGGGDLVSELLGMRGPDPLKAAQKKVKQHPNDTTAWIQLAVLYDGKSKEPDAIRAYNAVLKLKPNDTSGLTGLRQVWAKVTDQRLRDFNAAQADLSSTTAALPSSSSPITKWVGQDPLLTPYVDSLNTKVNADYATFIKAAKSWESVSRRYLKTIPVANSLERAPAELQLGEAASYAGDDATTIESYKTYLRLAPQSPYAPQVRKILAQMQKSNTKG